MANLLPASGTLSYNGVVFDALHKTKMRGKVIYDDAGRMVKWVEWTLEVEATIGASLAAGTPTDDTLDTLRDKLTQPRGKLTYQDKGFGEFRINIAPVFDANWGPKPEMLDFIPIGNTQTAMVTWKVVACIPQCPDATYTKSLVMACYDISHDFDSDGYVVATISGAIEIPLTTTASSRVISHTVDDYRDLVHYKVPLGFKRKSFRWKVSMDRRRAEFSIVDEEIPLPLPKGCSLCDLKHKVGSSNQPGAGFHVWSAEISGTIRVTPTVQRSNSFNRFMLVVRSRIATLRSGRGIRAPVVAPPPPAPGGEWSFTSLGVRILLGPSISLSPDGERIGGGIAGPIAAIQDDIDIIITALEMEEDIFGRDDRFRFAYSILSPLHQILVKSGLWTPIAGTNFVSYRRGIEQSMGPRGHSGIRVDAGDDTLIDLCIKSKKPWPQNRDSSVRIRRIGFPETDPQQQQQPGGQGVGDVDSVGPDGEIAIAGSSDVNETKIRRAPFLMYQCDLEYRQENHLVRHKPLNGTIQKTQNRVDATGEWEQITRSALTGPAVQSPSEDIIQRRQTPSVTVVLVGKAARLYARVPCLQLLSLDGIQVEEVGRYEKEITVGSIGGRMVYGREWRIEYMATGTPAKIPIPSNAFYATDGIA